MEHGGKVEFDEVMVAAQAIVLEMNAMIKEFILQLPTGSTFSVADIISRAPRYDCEHCGINFRDFSKYSDHIVKTHSVSVEYSKKWTKIQDDLDPLEGFEQPEPDIKAEPSQIVEVEMNDVKDEEEIDLEEELQSPIMIRQSATAESPFYKCKFCSELLPCSKEADKLKIGQHLKHHRIKKEDQKKNYDPNKRKQRINKGHLQNVDCEEDEDQKKSRATKRSIEQIEDEESNESTESKLTNHAKIKYAFFLGYNKTSHSFQCNLCNKIMPCKSEKDKKKIEYHLYSHQKRQKEMDERNDKRDLSELQCKVCFKKAKSWKGNGLVTDMERHMMLHHSGPKICKHCRKTDFSSDKEWTNHELWCYIHSVPVECQDCGEKLANRNLLKTHRNSVHRGPFVCDTCGKEYSSLRILKNHERLHLGTEFVCEVQDCGKKFTSRSILTEHVDRVHLNIRPFECETCGKCFTSKVMLKSHKGIHSDVLGYICPYCGKGFKQQSVLYRHKLSCPMNTGHL